MQSTTESTNQTKEKNNMNEELSDLWDYLLMNAIATQEELQLITSINGMNLESLESVLYYRTGYRSLEQIDDMEGEE